MTNGMVCTIFLVAKFYIGYKLESKAIITDGEFIFNPFHPINIFTACKVAYSRERLFSRKYLYLFCVGTVSIKVEYTFKPFIGK